MYFQTNALHSLICKVDDLKLKQVVAVTTRNSPSRLDVGFITLKSDCERKKAGSMDTTAAIKKRFASVDE